MAGKKRQIRRRKPVQDRSSATVDALLEATAQVLLSHGDERASTNEIARRAGVSIGSLYQYFDNKEALVAELARRHFGRIEAVVVEHLVVPGATPDPRAMIGRALRALVAVHRLTPRLSQVLEAEVPRVGELRIIEGLNQRSELLVAERLVAARSALRPANLVLAAQIVVRAVSGIIQATLRRSGGGDLPLDLEDELVDLVLRYLLRDPERPGD